MKSNSGFVSFFNPIQCIVWVRAAQERERGSRGASIYRSSVSRHGTYGARSGAVRDGERRRVSILRVCLVL